MNWWILLAFLLVPILVHLFSFRRARKHYFSTIRFITELTSKTKNKSRLKYLLVLGCRLILFGSLLTAIFWGTLSKGSVFSGGAVVYFDNTISNSISDISSAVLSNLIEDLNNRQIEPIRLVFNDTEKLVKADQQIDYDFIFSSISLNDVWEQLHAFDEQNIFILSDFQSFDSSSLNFSLIDSTRNYQLIYLNDLNKVRNVSIDSLWYLPNPDDYSLIKVYVTFNKYHITEGTIVIKLMQGDKQLSSIVKNVSDLQTVEFDLPVGTYGSFSIHIQGDDVLYDDEFYFVIAKKTRPQISILSNSFNQALSIVYDNPSLFDLHDMTDGVRDYDILKSSDIIVLNGFKEFPSEIVNQFSDKVFVVFPTQQADLASYNTLKDVSMQFIEDSLAVELGEYQNHPLFRGVFERGYNAGEAISLPPVFRIEGFLEEIINFRDGTPFLMKSGNIYFFNTDLSVGSGFSSSALFLPILYQIAFRSIETSQVPYVYPEEKFSLEVSPSDYPVKLRNERYEIVPEFYLAGTEIVIEVPGDISPGIYFATQQSDTLKRIGINVSKNESIMISPTLDDLRKVFEGYSSMKVMPYSVGSENNFLAGKENHSIWKYALILALMVIIIETMVHRYYR